MRLVSPAPVLVPPGAARAPPQAQMYPPQPQTAQQNMYSTQNGSSVGGRWIFLKKKTYFFKIIFLMVIKMLFVFWGECV